MEEIKNLEVKQETMPEVKDTGLTMWNDRMMLNYMFKFAQQLAESSLIPQAYQGRPADIMIAWDMGNRMNVSPLWVMQNSCVIRGKFGWLGQACKALIDGCGRFKRSRYVEVGNREDASWGYYLEAIDKNTNEVVKGPTVTIQMAIDEGWTEDKKNMISKWCTMPELMLKYRCSAFFARTECPNVLGGYQTAEELEDVNLTGYEGKRTGTLRQSPSDN